MVTTTNTTSRNNSSSSSSNQTSSTISKVGTDKGQDVYYDSKTNSTYTTRSGTGSGGGDPRYDSRGNRRSSGQTSEPNKTETFVTLNQQSLVNAAKGQVSPEKIVNAATGQYQILPSDIQQTQAFVQYGREQGYNPAQIVNAAREGGFSRPSEQQLRTRQDNPFTGDAGTSLRLEKQQIASSPQGGLYQEQIVRPTEKGYSYTSYAQLQKQQTPSRFTEVIERNPFRESISGFSKPFIEMGGSMLRSTTKTVGAGVDIAVSQFGKFAPLPKDTIKTGSIINSYDALTSKNPFKIGTAAYQATKSRPAQFVTGSDIATTGFLGATFLTGGLAVGGVAVAGTTLDIIGTGFGVYSIGTGAVMGFNAASSGNKGQFAEAFGNVVLGATMLPKGLVSYKPETFSVAKQNTFFDLSSEIKTKVQPVSDILPLEKGYRIESKDVSPFSQSRVSAQYVKLTGSKGTNIAAVRIVDVAQSGRAKIDVSAKQLATDNVATIGAGTSNAQATTVGRDVLIYGEPVKVTPKSRGKAVDEMFDLIKGDDVLIKAFDAKTYSQQTKGGYIIENPVIVERAANINPTKVTNEFEFYADKKGSTYFGTSAERTKGTSLKPTLNKNNEFDLVKAPDVVRKEFSGFIPKSERVSLLDESGFDIAAPKVESLSGNVPEKFVDTKARLSEVSNVQTFLMSKYNPSGNLGEFRSQAGNKIFVNEKIINSKKYGNQEKTTPTHELGHFLDYEGNKFGLRLERARRAAKRDSKGNIDFTAEENKDFVELINEYNTYMSRNRPEETTGSLLNDYNYKQEDVTFEIPARIFDVAETGIKRTGEKAESLTPLLRKAYNVINPKASEVFGTPLKIARNVKAQFEIITPQKVYPLRQDSYARTISYRNRQASFEQEATFTKIQKQIRFEVGKRQGATFRAKSESRRSSVTPEDAPLLEKTSLFDYDIRQQTSRAIKSKFDFMKQEPVKTQSKQQVQVTPTGEQVVSVQETMQKADTTRVTDLFASVAAKSAPEIKIDFQKLTSQEASPTVKGGMAYPQFVVKEYTTSRSQLSQPLNVFSEQTQRNKAASYLNLDQRQQLYQKQTPSVRLREEQVLRNDQKQLQEQKQVQKYKLETVTELKQATIINEITQNTPRTRGNELIPPRLPLFFAGGFMIEPKTAQKKKKLRFSMAPKVTKYTPTAFALNFNIKGKVNKLYDISSGLGVRPI
jgi:hypothetical protein